MKNLVLVLDPDRTNRGVTTFIVTLAQFDGVVFHDRDELENWLSLDDERGSRVSCVVVTTSYFDCHNLGETFESRLLKYAIPLVVIDRTITTPCSRDIAEEIGSPAPVFVSSLLHLSELLWMIRTRNLFAQRAEERQPQRTTRGNSPTQTIREVN